MDCRSTPYRPSPSVRQYASEGPCSSALSEVDAKANIVDLTSPRPFGTDNGAETMTYPEGNITPLDACLCNSDKRLNHRSDRSKI